MGQDNRKPDEEAAGNDARPEEAASAPEPDVPLPEGSDDGARDGENGDVEVNGTPVDLGSHNPDPNAHNWLHPEADLGTWDEVFHATEEQADAVPDERDESGGAELQPDAEEPGDEKAPGENDGPGEEPGDAYVPPHGPPPLAPDAPYEPSPAAPADTGTRQRMIIGVIVVAVLALMGLGIWLLVNMLSSQSQPAASEPAVTGSTQSPAPLPREIKALDFRLGDCFADFDSESSQALAVACNTGHSAQLVAVHTYAAQDAYPGREALKTKAQDSCKAAKLNTKSNEYTLKFQLVYPSPTSWDKGDRRVDCLVVVDTGNTIMDDLLQR